MDEFTRTEMFEPIRKIARRAKSLSSENTEGTPIETINHLAEYSVEFIAIFGAIYAALEMGKDQLVNIQVTPIEQLRDNPGDLEAFISDINYLTYNLPNLVNSLISLKNAWTSAYYKSRQVPYPVSTTSCSGTGSSRICTTTTEIRYRTEYYWDEPQNLTSSGMNHSSIDHWANYITHINSRLTHLYYTAPIAPTFQWQEESYDFTPIPVDLNTQNNIRTIGFGTAAIAFAFYEEFISLLQKRGHDPFFINQELSNKGIKRRSFLKLTGVTGLGLVIDKIQRGVVHLNSNIKELVFNNARNVNSQRELEPVNAFNRYMGTDVDTMLQQEYTIFQAMEGSIQNGNNSTEDWSLIQPHLNSVNNEVGKVVESMRTFLNYRDTSEYTIPERIATAMNNTWAHDQITEFADGRNAEANNTAFLEVAVLVAGLVGISLASEGSISLSDKIFDKLS